MISISIVVKSFKGFIFRVCVRRGCKVSTTQVPEANPKPWMPFPRGSAGPTLPADRA